MSAILKEMNKDDAWKEWKRYCDHNNSDYRTAIDRSNKHYQFTYGNQYTSTETAQMEARGQYPMAINKLLTYMQTITGMFISNAPAFKAMPQGMKDEILSAITNRVFQYVHNNNAGTLQLQDSIFKGLASDIGYIQVKLNDLGRIVYQSIDTEDVVVDSMSRDPYFRDASVIYIHKWLRVEDAKKIYRIPDAAIISDSTSYFQSYYKSDNERHVVEKIFASNFQYVKIIEGYHRILEKEINIIDGQEVDTGKIKKRFRKVTLIGYKYAFIEDLPETITEHCIIPIYCYNTKNVYKIGLTAMLYDYQRLLNKSYVTLLFNAQTLGSPRLLMEEGSVPNNDVEGWENNFAIPASVNIYTRGTTPPVVVPSQQLPQAFTQLAQSIAGEMSFASIPDELATGDVKNLERKLDMYQMYQFVMNKLRMFTNVYEGALSVIGKVVMQYFCTYADAETKSRVLELDEKQKIVAKLQQKKIPLDEWQQMAYRKQRIEAGEEEYVIDNDIINYKKELEYIKKVQYIMSSKEFIDIDVLVVPNSYLASNQQMQFSKSMLMYQQGLVDNQQVLLDSDYENKEELIQRMSTIENLIKTVNEMKTVIEQYENEIANMRNAIFEGEINQQTMEHQFKLDKTRNDYMQKERAKQKITSNNAYVSLQTELLNMRERQANAMLDLKKAFQELQIEKKKVKSEKKTETDAANNRVIMDI